MNIVVVVVFIIIIIIIIIVVVFVVVVVVVVVKIFCFPGGGPKNRGNPYSCVCLHGDRKPHERKANLQSFKDGDVRFLICTDVAARGLGECFGLSIA